MVSVVPVNIEGEEHLALVLTTEQAKSLLYILNGSRKLWRKDLSVTDQNDVESIEDHAHDAWNALANKLVVDFEHANSLMRD